MMEESDRQQMAELPTRKRCVNLDWLEIHAREPVGQPHTADYFRNQGCEVQEREYGTRVYKEMFVIYGSDGLPAIEVRRNPASSGLNGIHDAEETHIRLVNRMCYYDDCAEMFEKWLENHHYTDVRISRVDVCLDFVRFDFGDEPSKFVRRYLKHKYAKINQGNINAHGKDSWEGQEWNSLKWGSPMSCVSTKMYNKTMELKDTKSGLFGKPYIRQAWMLCGFIDNMQSVTLQGEEVQVWRVEFSLKSAAKGWCPIELDGKPNHKYSLRNTLDMYKGRDRLLTIFASLSKHYFRFKKYKSGVRKDRCEDKKLFDFTSIQTTYKLDVTERICGDGNKDLTRFNRLLQLLVAYDMSKFSGKEKEAAEILINALKEDKMFADLARPSNQADRAIMRAKFLQFIYTRVNDPIRVSEILKDTLKVCPNVWKYFNFDSISENRSE